MNWCTFHVFPKMWKLLTMGFPMAMFPWPLPPRQANLRFGRKPAANPSSETWKHWRFRWCQNWRTLFRGNHWALSLFKNRCFINFYVEIKKVVIFFQIKFLLWLRNVSSCGSLLFWVLDHISSESSAFRGLGYSDMSPCWPHQKSSLVPSWLQGQLVIK